MSERGKFIVFEGIDGCGKTTQIKLLERLMKVKNIPVYVTKEPSNGPYGQLLRRIIDKKVSPPDSRWLLNLFAADRIDHLTKDGGIISMLEKGINVVCDRYYLSSYAYNQNENIGVDDITEANSKARQLLKPDVHIFIDMSTNTAINRIKNTRSQFDLFETESKLNLTEEKYREIIKKMTDDENIFIVDGDRDIHDVFDYILECSVIKSLIKDAEKDKDILCLTHYDDGKEKYQSHEISCNVFSCQDDKFNVSSADNVDITGIYAYGETESEALDMFKTLFFEKLDYLNKFADKLRNNTVDIVEVDCLNKPI